MISVTITRPKYTLLNLPSVALGCLRFTLRERLQAVYTSAKTIAVHTKIKGRVGRRSATMAPPITLNSDLPGELNKSVFMGCFLEMSDG